MAIAVVANIYVMTVDSYGPSSLLQFGWGIFFLPPYLHLLLERRRKTALTHMRPRSVNRHNKALPEKNDISGDC
jgi:hypothetical protein